MEIERSDQRVAFITKCILHINNKKYSCLLDNISTTGASIDMNTTVPPSIHVGDPCVLKVLLLSPVTYSGKIVRKTADHVGVQFLEN